MQDKDGEPEVLELVPPAAVGDKQESVSVHTRQESFQRNTLAMLALSLGSTVSGLMVTDGKWGQV